MTHSPLIAVMLKAAQKAAKGMLRDFGEVGELQVSRKGTMDFVTQTDLRAEKILHEELSRARPKFGFLMEEGGELPGEDGEHRWVIDPLDGTTNFIHAVPYFCIALSLEKKLPGDAGWEPLAALIYEPLRDEAFFAEKDKGAFHHSMGRDRRMAVSGRSQLQEALVVTHSPKHDLPDFKPAAELFQEVTRHCKGVRCFGATALDLAYLAAGRFDLAWYTAFKRWDVSAGILLAREAGATVTQLTGEEGLGQATSLLVGTPKLHRQLLGLLRPLWR